jgi:hypothetical protein
MKAQRKNSKLKFKVFFKVLKFLSLFSHKDVLKKKRYFEILGGWGAGGMGRGGGEVVMEHAGPLGLY